MCFEHSPPQLVELGLVNLSTAKPAMTQQCLVSMVTPLWRLQWHAYARLLLYGHIDYSSEVINTFVSCNQLLHHVNKQASFPEWDGFYMYIRYCITTESMMTPTVL